MFFHSKFAATVLICISLTGIIEINGQMTECNKNAHPTLEHKLKEKLFCQYDPSIRPAKNETEKTTVAVELDIRHIDLDEKQNVLYSQMLIGLTWNDAFLQWDYKDNNITQMDVPAEEVWLPDLTIYNNWESWATTLTLENQDAFVMYSGTVMYYNIIDVPSHCSLDVSNWPYDVNVCNVSLASRSYFSHMVDFELLNNHSFVLKQYYRSNVWDIKDTKVWVKPTYFGDNSSYSINSIVAHLTIARESSSLFSSVTTPITIIVFTLLSTFWMEPFETYRIVFGVFSMIGHLAYLMYLGRVVPPNGDKPVLIVTLVRNSLILCWASLVLHASERVICQSQKRPPVWLSNVSAWFRRNGISSLFCIPREMEKNAASRGTEEIDARKSIECLQIAAIIDRFFFIVYVVIYLVMLFDFITLPS